MERPLSRALLLLVLLAPTGGAGRSDVCRLGTYGALLLDHPAQCPSRLDASGESSLHRAPTSPGKARVADPPAKETRRPWIRLGASAQKVARSPNDQHEVGLLYMEGEECHKWIDGQVDPVETFSCPTEEEEWKMFCCGTCTASYCCSSRKNRLHQESCPEVVKGPEDQETEDPTGPTEDERLLLEGEECHKWIDGQVDPVETFSCPTEEEQWKLFCCGTCTASYCCSSRKNRLHQENCPEVVKGPEDQETEDPTGPTVELHAVSILDFVVIAVVLSTIFTIFLCGLKWWMKWREKRVKQRMVNTQADLVRGIQAVPLIDIPRRVRSLSATPDLLSLRGAESQNPSGWPTAAANAPCGSGNPIQQITMSPAFARGREEERETVL